MKITITDKTGEHTTITRTFELRDGLGNLPENFDEILIDDRNEGVRVVGYFGGSLRHRVVAVEIETGEEVNWLNIRAE